MKITKQNPLGIIAIFAGLSEVAGTVMIPYLSIDLQAVFIWFVMTFPILIVGLFFLVLYQKPQNFYSPDYYKDEQNFVATILKISRTEIDDLYNELSNEDIPEEVRERIETKIMKIEDNFEDITKQQKIEDDVLNIFIDGEVVTGNTVKKFYKNVMNYLKENDISISEYVPHETGKVRRLIHTKNEHINGSKFTAPIIVSYGECDYFLETHKSKSGAKKDMIKFLELIGLDVE